MNILGLVYTSHDAGLALLTDGKPNIILEEERFNRIKHTLKYPRMAMDDVFGASGRLDLSNVDVITTPWNMERIRVPKECPTLVREYLLKLHHQIR